MKGGLGSTSMTGQDGLVVGAIVAVNAVGDIKDPDTREILVGARNAETAQWIDSCAYLEKHGQSQALAGTNTTIGVIAVNAKLTKAEAKKNRTAYTKCTGTYDLSCPHNAGWRYDFRARHRR